MALEDCTYRLTPVGILICLEANYSHSLLGNTMIRFDALGLVGQLLDRMMARASIRKPGEARRT